VVKSLGEMVTCSTKESSWDWTSGRIQREYFIKVDGTRSCPRENLWCRNWLQILHCWLARCGSSSSKTVLVPRSNRISFEALTFRRAPIIFSSRFLDSFTKVIGLQQDLIFLGFFTSMLYYLRFFILFLNFQYISHQPISVADFGWMVNQVKHLISCLKKRSGFSFKFWTGGSPPLPWVCTCGYSCLSLLCSGYVRWDTALFDASYSPAGLSWRI
jgi:hypothetical protein